LPLYFVQLRIAVRLPLTKRDSACSSSEKSKMDPSTRIDCCVAEHSN